jgi:hypothetical protein
MAVRRKPCSGNPGIGALEPQSSTGNPGICWRSLKILKQPGGNCGLYDFSGLDKILKYKYEFEYVTPMDLRERPAMREIC